TRPRRGQRQTSQSSGPGDPTRGACRSQTPFPFPTNRRHFGRLARKCSKGLEVRCTFLTSVDAAPSAPAATACYHRAENLQAGGRRFESCTAHHPTFQRVTPNSLQASNHRRVLKRRQERSRYFTS